MIKSRINLYTASLLPPKQRVNFTTLMIALAVLLSASVLLYGFSLYQLNDMQHDLQQANAQQQMLIENKNTLEQQVAQRVPDRELVARVELEEQRLALKHLLKNELVQRTALISQGYSPILMDLATVSDASVWLSRIYFNQTQIEFEGFGQQPSSIPRWIERLNTADTLKGFSFAAMTMDRGEDQPLAFKLTSTPVVSKETAQ